jgi:hypothetical protein
MTIPILQVLLTIGGCYGLWRFWRALGGRGRASHIITAGFLIRALASQLLFWISWLHLPIARSLQLGDGFWFFAVDGPWYLSYARDLLHRGPGAIVFITPTYASRIFTQWFTVFAGAFGVVASTAILFNCVAYLAACALIVRLAREGRTRDFALAAIAFGPAAILWSLQLLKDTFFVLLIVAMVAIFSEWQKLWRGDVLRRSLAVVICGAAMIYAVYAIAGTRWYVGAIIAGASLLFLGLVANLPRPRFAGSVIAVLLFMMLGQAFLLGGDFDVPTPVRMALDVRQALHPRIETEAAKVVLTHARRGFQTTPGGTMIAPGPALVASMIPVAPKSADAAGPETPELPVAATSLSGEILKPAEKVVPAVATIAPAPPPVTATIPPAPAAAPVPVPAPVVAPVPVPVPVLAPVPVRAAVPAATQVPVAAPVSAVVPAAAPVLAPAPAPPPSPTVTTETIAKTETIATIAPAVVVEQKPVPVRKHHHTHKAPSTRPAPVVVVAAAPVKATPPHVAAPVVRAEPPQSLTAKILTGGTAMFIPRIVAQSAGLVRIGGGRGFWFFADFDTLVFDFVVFLAFAFSARSIVRRQRRVTPLFILVALVFAGLAAPMIYTVTNFGTLFRLREMLYVLAALLPLTLDLPATAR